MAEESPKNTDGQLDGESEPGVVHILTRGRGQLDASHSRPQRGLRLTHSYNLLYTLYVMGPRPRVVCFRPDTDVAEAMEALREQTGASLSWQTRQALRVWLERKGALKKTPMRSRTAPKAKRRR